MYKNVGNKIQTVAKIVAWLGIVFTALLALITIYGGLNTNDIEMIVNGVVLLIFGPLASWLSSLTLVGFGKLVQTNDEMKNQIERLNDQVNELKNK